MAMRPYSAAVAGIRPPHPRGGMQNLTVGNANGRPAARGFPTLQTFSDGGLLAAGRFKSPQGKTDPKGRTPEAESCNLSGLGSSRGSGTCRALPDATFCRPFRAGTLRIGDVGSL